MEQRATPAQVLTARPPWWDAAHGTWDVLDSTGSRQRLLTLPARA